MKGKAVSINGSRTIKVKFQWITPAELSGLYDFANPVKKSNPMA
jgi:hypothetical protein